jgi:hypothetical protein
MGFSCAFLLLLNERLNLVEIGHAAGQWSR